MVYAAIFEVGSDVEIPQEAVVSAAGAAINDNDLTLGCADRYVERMVSYILGSQTR